MFSLPISVPFLELVGLFLAPISIGIIGAVYLLSKRSKATA